MKEEGGERRKIKEGRKVQERWKMKKEGRKEDKGRKERGKEGRKKGENEGI